MRASGVLPDMKRIRLCLAALGLLAAFPGRGTGQEANPTVDEIMARVAANQEKSIEARKQFVYKQEQLFALRRTSGKLQCQVQREYAITPGSKGIERKLVSQKETGDAGCDGDNNKVTVNIDGAMAESMSSQPQKRDDDIPRNLFPLTAREQRFYVYKLEGEEQYRGRRAWRVSFLPKRDRNDEGAWKGEALIDAEEFQPISVVTDLAVKIPMAVRVLLGTNVRGLGFSVSYQRVADGVWFPASMGGEFKLNALFFYRRTVTINVKNSDFKKTDVASSVTYGKIEQLP